MISQKRSDRRRNGAKTAPTIGIPPILSPSTSTLYEPSIHLTNILNVSTSNKSTSSANNTNNNSNNCSILTPQQQQFLQQQQQQQQQQSTMTSTSTTPPLLSVKVTVPKVTKPQRTQVIFEHVLIGLRYKITNKKHDFIELLF